MRRLRPQHTVDAADIDDAVEELGALLATHVSGKDVRCATAVRSVREGLTPQRYQASQLDIVVDVKVYFAQCE